MATSSDAAIERPQWQREIEALEERGRLAFLAQDIDTLERLWSDQLLVNSPINRIHSKRQVLDLLLRGVIQHTSFEVEIEFITRHAAMVVVMGRDLVTNTSEGPRIHRRFTNVWYEDGPSWRLIARQATIIGEPPESAQSVSGRGHR